MSTDTRGNSILGGESDTCLLNYGSLAAMDATVSFTVCQDAVCE